MGEMASTAADQGGFDLSQFYDVFFEEAGDNLMNMESMLLHIDVDAPPDEDLHAIFRVAHSIKGGAATFGFGDVTHLTHELETLLDRVRRHELALDRSMVDVLLEASDVVKAQLARYQGNASGNASGGAAGGAAGSAFDGAGEGPDASGLIGRIKLLATGAKLAAAPALEPAVAPEVAPAPEPSDDLPPGTRRILLRVGPLRDAAVVNDIEELFRDIPDLGTLTAVDEGVLDAEDCRRFRITTQSPDLELIELFSFHVAREQIRIEPEAPSPRSSAELTDAAELPDAPEPSDAPEPPVPSGPAAPSPPQQAANGVVEEGDGFGFFVDPRTLPAAQRSVADPAGRADGADAQASGATRPAPARKPGEGRGESRGEGRSEGKAAASPAHPANLESNTLRVPVERVDQLINLVGELVITQAMISQQVKDLDPTHFRALTAGVADLERNSRHLQEAVMSIRMIPMSFVFNRFPRMIRDLATKLGKQIELKLIGEATELDKGLIEKIVDPLTHLVRNSADHGLETPDRRRAAGKNDGGTITLAASHQGGSIVIEVRDDGQGLRREKILAKGRERGLAVRDDMTDEEVWALIWEAGFSTADQVSDVSGRGVGMDVVRRNIQTLGGTAEIESAEGYGTCVRVRLPLTLAIMDGMSIRVGEETYILPLSSVVESFQIETGMIQSVGSSGRVVKVREEFMPVLALEDVLQVPPSPSPADGPKILVVVEAEGRRVAAIVDELLGQHQIVVKNLEANYRRVPNISGATILGDGRVALIIDVGGLVKRARH